MMNTVGTRENRWKRKTDQVLHRCNLVDLCDDKEGGLFDNKETFVRAVGGVLGSYGGNHGHMWPSFDFRNEERVYNGADPSICYPYWCEIRLLQELHWIT